jgi:tetratricopeptide (TPR) repeat protein
VKSLIYTVVLLAVLVACVIVLRSLDGEERPSIPAERAAPVVTSEPPLEPGVDTDSFEDSGAAELYAAGSELFSLWHVREATRLFERAVAADSSWYGPWVRLVECYAHPLVGREDDAVAALRIAWGTRVSDADTTFLAGIEQLFVVRDPGAAVELLERAVQTEVSHEDAVYYYALALMLSGRVEDAVDRVEELVQRDETVGRFVELGIRCRVETDDLGAAANEARELARMYAEEPYPYVLLAMVEEMAGRHNSAVEFCNNALVLDSKYIPAILARANLYASAGQFEAARVSFEKLLMFDDPILRSLGHEGIGFVDLLSGRFNRGLEELDEAIRAAMLAGSVRRGLAISARLVGHLCELGQGDEAVAVVDRWVTGFGDIPVGLAEYRVKILEGDMNAANEVLGEIQSSKAWSEWMSMMAMDYIELVALAHIRAEDYNAALAILAQAGRGVRPGTRDFLGGYAAFQSGGAEMATEAFAEVGRRFYTVEFPYHGDPVRFVRSLYYLGDANLARGNEAESAVYYERFLEFWGDADWDVQAVSRARQKLESFATAPSSPD